MILVIDQGTTSTRAIAFGPDAEPVANAKAEFPQIYPRPGWVEHDPEALWETTLSTAREALKRAGCDASSLAAIGIANQRETALIWERATDKPIANAIVWQDRRTAELCETLKAEGAEPPVTAATGLVIDLYFSATKIAWLLHHVPGARAAAERGELAFGTVDAFLLWRLTKGPSTRPTRPTPRARCSTTSAPAPGTKPCCACSGFPGRCCPRSRTRPQRSGRARPSIWRRRFDPAR